MISEGNKLFTPLTRGFLDLLNRCHCVDRQPERPLYRHRRSKGQVKRKVMCIINLLEPEVLEINRVINSLLISYVIR